MCVCVRGCMRGCVSHYTGADVQRTFRSAGECAPYGYRATDGGVDGWVWGVGVDPRMPRCSHATPLPCYALATASSSYQTAEWVAASAILSPPRCRRRCCQLPFSSRPSSLPLPRNISHRHCHIGQSSLADTQPAPVTHPGITPSCYCHLCKQNTAKE